MAYVPPGSYPDYEMSRIQGMQDQIMKVINEKFVDTMDGRRGGCTDW